MTTDRLTPDEQIRNLTAELARHVAALQDATRDLAQLRARFDKARGMADRFGDQLIAARAELERVTADRDQLPAKIAEDIAAAIETHFLPDNRTAVQAARIARHHATQYGPAAVPGSPSRAQEPDALIRRAEAHKAELPEGVFCCDGCHIALVDMPRLAAVQPPAADTPTPTQRVLDKARRLVAAWSAACADPDVDMELHVINAEQALAAAVDALDTTPATPDETRTEWATRLKAHGNYAEEFCPSFDGAGMTQQERAHKRAEIWRRRFGDELVDVMRRDIHIGPWQVAAVDALTEDPDEAADDAEAARTGGTFVGKYLLADRPAADTLTPVQRVLDAARAWRAWYGERYNPRFSSAQNDLAAAVDALTEEQSEIIGARREAARTDLAAGTDGATR